ncbi:MAG: metallophosphoesterase family protein [Clostridia bacterium]|nr:metallophosphoesterase family protein [Clostridia bacterium]
MKKLAYLFLFALLILTLSSCHKDAPDEGGEAGPHVCEFVEKSTKSKYIKTRATCIQRAEYYYSCSCGEMGTEVFEHGDFGGHSYGKNTADQYLIKEATVKTSAIYYKSCSRCGTASNDTFVSGTPIALTDEEKRYVPTSVTVTLYDTEESVYGFTYNTYNAPGDPVIQIKKAGDTEWEEIAPASYEATTQDGDGVSVSYFISKAEITLKRGTVYVYRVLDRAFGIITPEVTLKACDPASTSFTFSHVSDSQAGPAEFGRVMKSIADSSDFVIHGGDVVQYAHKEAEWTEMLDGNYEYIMGMPIIPITGNHETSYNNATFEIYKHFNNKIPEQTSVALGYYYSFVYGDVKFIMLNTNDLEDNRLKAEQYNWLVDELRNNTCKWTVVSMHNPMYSVGKYGADQTRNQIALALREQLGSLFAEYGVDLVLQAHDHAVSRTFPIDADGATTAEMTETENGVEYIVDPDGVIYIMNGPAGTQQRAPVAIEDGIYAYAETGRRASWADITVDGDTLTVTVKWHDGTSEQVYHTWGIKKS